MTKINTHIAGFALGIFLAFWHLLWAILVGFGFAQPFLDWIYWLHFMNNPFRVMSFDVGHAAMLVVVVSIIGYIIGWILATIWNTMQAKAQKK